MSPAAHAHGSLLEAVLRLLQSSRDARPEEVRRQTLALAADFPGVALDVTWERPSADAHLRYHVLVRDAAANVFSLSVGVPEERPWALLGAQRWSDAEVLEVGFTVLRMEDVVFLLDAVWDEARIAEQLIRITHLSELRRQYPGPVSDAEVQDALDQFRRAKGLCDETELRAWMEETSTSHARLEAHAEELASLRRLRAALCPVDAAGYLQDHGEDLAHVRIRRVSLDQDGGMREVLGWLRHPDPTIAALEQLAPGAAVDGAWLRASELRARFGRLGEPGTVLGPVRWRRRWVACRVIEIRPPVLDAATIADIEAHVFDAWLRAHRKTLPVRWLWGRVARAS